jgi:diphthine-ammonia ligase
MKFVGLISGGKDSIYNIIECMAHGHTLIAVANLRGKEAGVELDSQMYQTVGLEIVPFIAECLEVPLIQRELQGTSVNTGMYYQKSSEESKSGLDEVEDLYELIADVKTRFPDVQAVSSGAILSNYQRLRVENICQRHKLMSLAYLWNRD